MEPISCCAIILLFVFGPIIGRHAESIGNFISSIFRFIFTPIRLLWRLFDSDDYPIENENEDKLFTVIWIIIIISCIWYYMAGI